MKVAVVCPYAFEVHGGVQDQVSRLVRWLRDAGHEAWAVAPGRTGPEGTRNVGRFVSVSANRSRAPIALGPKVPKRIAAAVEDADVVHIHEPFMPLVSLGALFADTPPKVGTFHAAPGPFVRTFYRGAAWPLRGAARRLKAVTAVSDVAAAALGTIADPTIVPNGIDVDSYGDTERVPGRVLFMGRDDRRKGLDLLLEAWPVIHAGWEEATLHVVGAEREPAGAVSFLGRVSEDRKRRELSRAEVLAVPNRGGESFGIVVLEGLASGCSVVASDLPAFRAVAAEAAAYVDVGDRDALAAEVVAILGSAERRSLMAAAGVARSRRFGRDEVLAAYLSAYEAACGAG